MQISYLAKVAHSIIFARLADEAFASSQAIKLLWNILNLLIDPLQALVSIDCQSAPCDLNAKFILKLGQCLL